MLARSVLRPVVPVESLKSKKKKEIKKQEATRDGSRARELASTLSFSCRPIQSTSTIGVRDLEDGRKSSTKKSTQLETGSRSVPCIYRARSVQSPSFSVQPHIACPLRLDARHGSDLTCMLHPRRRPLYLFRSINSFLHAIDPASQSEQENKTRNKTPWMDGWMDHVRARPRVRSPPLDPIYAIRF
jgi:hypothetical protein